MNPAVSHLARALGNLHKMKGFYRQEESGTKKLKEWTILGKNTDC